MKFFNILLYHLLYLLTIHTQAQDQPISPLISSFEQYQQMKATTELGFEWVSLGPVINSARVEAVQVDHTRPGYMYVAFGSGNLWKTTSNGLNWKPIFENQPALGIGDITLAPSNTDIIYVGTGESLKKPRNFTMPGTGVYRSDDGGETWKHLGLNDSWHIGEIAVHPTNPDHVVVAVMGHFWSTNKHRGLYLTTDGGQTWEQVLYIDEKTGANDVIFSNSNPNILYASMWENNPGISGENSGVYKSEDGGKTWKKCLNGLPNSPETGRIGVAVSHTNPNKIYALIDNLANRRESAAEVYKSLDGGETWKKTHKNDLLIFPGIGWYFTDIYVSPENDEEIYALGVKMAHSTDGGKTFDMIGGTVTHLTPSLAQTLHLDHCELWINPLNPRHLVLGNDGGVYVSHDKGQHWLHYNNIPTGEFYDITLDFQEPYNIYGGVQDDATVFGPAKEWNPRFPDSWKYLWIDAWSGGDGCFTFIDPEDPNRVYFSLQHGHVRRKDLAADTSKYIGPRLPDDHDGELRTNFIAPYFLSKHNSNTLYLAGNYVFKSTNRGDSWKIISEDLSVSSHSQKHATAAGAIAESPINPGHLYMGTDKGAFWISKNDGESWKEYSKGLPNTYIRSIVPSRHKVGRVYIALTGINYDDFNNYLFKSENDGKKWESITANLPNEVANVMIEDPWNENILYAGLYRGVYVSLDQGNHWQLLGTNMPAVSIADLEIHELTKDLIVATHGRGIYKVNLAPLYKTLADSFSPENLHLFDLPTARRPKINDTHNDVDYRTLEKVPITFWTPSKGKATLQLFDEEKIVWRISLDARKGLNQYRWDLVKERVKSNTPYFIHYDRFIRAGVYEVRFLMNGKSSTQKLRVEKQGFK